MYITLFFLLMGFAGTIFYIWRPDWSESELHQSMQWMGYTVGAVFLLSTLICMGTAHTSYGEIRGFKYSLPIYRQNIENAYSKTVNIEKEGKSGNILIPGNGLANMQHSKNIVDMIKDLNNKIIKCNQMIEVYRILNNNFFYDQFYPDLPEDITLITN